MRAFVDDKTHELVIEAETELEERQIALSLGRADCGPLPVIFRERNGDPVVGGWFKGEDPDAYYEKLQLAHALRPPICG